MDDKKSKNQNDVSTAHSKLTTLSFILQQLLMLIIAAALIWGWMLLQNPKLFPIHKIEIKASYQHVKPDELEKTVLPFTKKSFFALRLKALNKQLLEIPWVGEAQVEKIWPDTLLIKIQEEIPVARWNDHSFINAHGDIFTPSDLSFNSQLPMLSGPDAQAEEILQNFQTVSQIVQRQGLHISHLILNDERSWVVVLDNGSTVILGNLDITAKMQRFIDVYKNKLSLQKGKIERIDLRYDNGLAVEWRNG